MSFLCPVSHQTPEESSPVKEVRSCTKLMFFIVIHLVAKSGVWKTTVNYTATLRGLMQTPPPFPPIAFCGHKIPTGIFKSLSSSPQLAWCFWRTSPCQYSPRHHWLSYHRRRGYPIANCVYINKLTFLCNLSFLTHGGPRTEKEILPSFSCITLCFILLVLKNHHP